MLKSLLILGALAAGLLLPQLHEYAFTLRPFLMALLFFSFLGVKLQKDLFAWQQLAVAALLPFFGFGVYYLGGLYDENLAMTLLLMGVAPTAVITPVLAELMRRSAGYMIGAIIITHAVFALSIPVLLPLLLGIELSWAGLGDLVVTIGSTVLIPLVAAQLVRAVSERLTRGLRRLAPWAFVLFLSNIAVASGSLSHYLRYESTTAWTFIWLTTAAITALMLLNFLVGSRVAPTGQRVEGSLAFGRKNTMLSIWIALEYINPLVVLGPMLYILVQNVFVAGQIAYLERLEGAAAGAK